MRRSALLGLLMLGGCVASPGALIVDQENSLSAAGFKVLPASSPERQAMLARLPANVVAQHIEGDQVSYLYGDPLVCHCLYVGDQQAFAHYQQDQIARRVADSQLAAARLNEDLAWDWGPWGYGGGFGLGFYR